MIVKKEWGSEVWLVNNELYCAKILYLRDGFRCSLHCHPVKDETFIVQQGKVFMEIGGLEQTLTPGDIVRIHPGQYHRFTGLADSVILEVSTRHDDADVIRKEPSGKALDL